MITYESGLEARGENPSAFDERCMLAACVAPPSNTVDILGRRALAASADSMSASLPSRQHSVPASVDPASTQRSVSSLPAGVPRPSEIRARPRSSRCDAGLSPRASGGSSLRLRSARSASCESPLSVHAAPAGVRQEGLLAAGAAECERRLISRWAEPDAGRGQSSGG